ncbi:hypothetical protein BST61_g4437 [Cercospora zeina]
MKSEKQEPLRWNRGVLVSSRTIEPETIPGRQRVNARTIPRRDGRSLFRTARGRWNEVSRRVRRGIGNCRM